jgi:hypothetical protein
MGEIPYANKAMMHVSCHGEEVHPVILIFPQSVEMIQDTDANLSETSLAKITATVEKCKKP